MSKQYPGGIISKTPPAPSGPYADSTAPGIWTLEQQAAYAKLGQWPTAGNVNPSAFIENLFSTYLYTGNGSTQTITNGIDLSTYGGLVWTKARTTTYNHCLTDTIRGGNKQLFSNTTDASTTSSPAEISSFNTTGYTLAGGTVENVSGQNFVGWTFREQPKFFDVVTYTGTASAQNIAHNLGSTPACIIVKKTNDTSIWPVYHSSLGGADKFLVLNATDAVDSASSLWNNTAPTSTQFTVGTSGSTNGSGNTFVAYLFASNAGGFGLTGTDNVISCGSFTTDGSGNASVTLGYEPQWIMAKASSGTISDWFMYDNMRGLDVSNGSYLRANSSASETAVSPMRINATGFSVANSTFDSSSTYIYIAIRRGPMAVPTLGTSVYAPVAYTGDATNNRAITTGFVSDTVWWKSRSNATNWRSATLLIGANTTSSQNLTAVEEYVAGYYIKSYQNTGFTYDATDPSYNQSGYTYVTDAFKRAPGFHDVVCWTGNNGSNQRVNHNLTVVPELIIYKGRNKDNYWRVYYGNINKYLVLNLAGAETTSANAWGSSAPTTTDFGINCGSMDLDNFNAVAYLFATVSGVSKVGSYTGTGALITVNCGFTSGARFVLIRRTDATGNWYNYDSARGITSGSDPSLWVNSASAETTGTNYVDTDTTGFKVTAAAPAQLNDPGGTYIFLAIA